MEKAGTVAAVLNSDIFDLLELDDNKLLILYNEAQRQRWIEASIYRFAYNGKGKDFSSRLEDMTKIHGPYTEGFYKRERQKLKEKLNGIRS